ncbi:MAG: replication protein [Geobacteraceae bacterium]|nr:replication protein [Geobacteraceae bacterium]
MASPQTENGHMDLANELVDAFCRYWPPSGEGQVLWVVFRKTYGWNKKADKISVSQFQELTGLSRRTVIYALQNLEAKQMVIIEKQPGGTNLISFQKDYEKWLVHNCAPQISKKREIAKDCQLVHNCAPVHNSVRTSAPPVHPQKTLYKNHRTSSPESLRLSGLLADLILENNPCNSELSNGKRVKAVNRWAEDIDKLLRLDGQTPEKVEVVMRWAQSDSFWRSNILSGSALRRQWNKLVVRVGNAGNSADARYDMFKGVA